MSFAARALNQSLDVFAPQPHRRTARSNQEKEALPTTLLIYYLPLSYKNR